MKKSMSEQVIITADPFRCRMWRLHDRMEEFVTEESCRHEIDSFTKHGQLVPVVARRLPPGASHEFELIYGARRLFVARHLNIPIRAEVREISDREAVVLMDVENRLRQDISPYERGSSYASWLRDGLFTSQDDIASALRISASQVSRLLKIARLPAVVSAAFQSPEQICEGWGLELAAALAAPQSRERIVRKAREIALLSPRPAAAEVYRRLLAAVAVGRAVTKKARDEVFHGRDGRLLFRIRYGRTAVALLLPVQRTSAKAMGEICDVVSSLLQPPVDQPRECADKRSRIDEIRGVAGST
jgi:ParB family chromosome partitioning protein